jgi:hypothetical protein
MATTPNNLAAKYFSVNPTTDAYHILDSSGDVIGWVDNAGVLQGSLASAPGLALPAAGIASPQPAYAAEAPSNQNPAFYIQDANGFWHQQAGVDTTTTNPTSGPPAPAGTLTFYRRTYFRDTGRTTQAGKNAFVSINHASGVGTVTTNQDRALWLTMDNLDNSTSELYSMACIQAELDVYGTPTFQAEPDGELMAFSAQCSDNHLGTLSGPGLGIGCLRANYFREVGAGSWSSGPNVIGIRSRMQNNSQVPAIENPMIAFMAEGIEEGPSANLPYVGFYSKAPTTRFDAYNYGLEIGDFGTNSNDFAIYVAGGQSLFNAPVGLNSLFAGKGGIAVLGGLSGMAGLNTAQLSVPVWLLLGQVGTVGTTTYTYQIVARDVNGDTVPGATHTITNGNATLDSTNFIEIEISPTGIGPASYDVYRVVGGATQGKIGSLFPQAVNSTQNNSLIFKDTGLSGDSSSAPTGNTTGGLVLVNAASFGQYVVSGLPTGVEGRLLYATNGRKVGEGSGSGTGVPVYFSNGAWRVFSTDANVQS